MDLSCSQKPPQGLEYILCGLFPSQFMINAMTAFDIAASSFLNAMTAFDIAASSFLKSEIARRPS